MKETDLIRLITEQVLQELGEKNNALTLPVALSNRHLHLSAKDLAVLFGQGYTMQKLRDLSQPGQYAAKETVTLVGPKGAIEGVRILGPVRKETQIELALGDGFKLGIAPPVRASGDIAGTPGCVIIGPKGVVSLERGVICALRHIHMSNAEAQRYGVRDTEMVKVKTEGLRSLIFDQVLVRVDPAFNLEMHIDIEEGNAAGLKNGDRVQIIKEVEEYGISSIRHDRD